MKNGGKRQGAGRPKGSTSRPSIFDYWDKGDIKEFFEFLKDNYKEDMRLMQWVGDHLLGKPPQAITGPDGAPLIISFDKSFNATALEAAGDSKE